MDTFEIYSYYDTSVYAKVLTAVGFFFADSNFIDLIQIGIAFGILFTAMSVFLGGRGSPMQMVSYFLGAAVMFNLLFVPKSTVTIIDKSLMGGENGATTVQNVPTVVAYLAHLSTSAGLWADRIALQLFTPLPGLMEKERGLDDLGSIGTHMTRKIMLQTMMAKTTNSEYQRGITEYVRECVGYDLITHYKSIDDIKNAGDTWDALGDTNPALFVTIPVRNGSVVEYETMNCQQAHEKLGLLGQQVAQDAMKRQAGLAFPNIQETEMHTVYANILTKSMNGFMRDETSSTQKTFENMVVQNTILNSMGVLSSNPVATAKASLGVSAAATQKAELAKSFVYTITIVQLLAFAFFPIAIAMAIIAGPSGIRIIFTVIKVFFWLAILQFAQVIIDALILMNAQSSAKAVTAGFEGGSINSMEAIGGIINGMEDQLQVALFASLGLTWAMMSTFGSSVGGALATSLFSGAQTYNERTATDMAAEGRNTFGETSYMNARMGNESSYSYDVAPTVNQGGFQTKDSLGYTNTHFGDGRVATDGSARKNAAAHATAAVSKAAIDSLNKSVEAARMQAKIDTETADRMTGTAMQSASSVLAGIGSNKSKMDSVGLTISDSTSKQIEKVDQATKEIAKKLGLSEADVGRDMMGVFREASVTGSTPSVLPWSAKATAGARATEEREYKETVERAMSDIFKTTSAENIKEVRDTTEAIATRQEVQDALQLTDSKTISDLKQGTEASNYTKSAQYQEQQANKMAELASKMESLQRQGGINALSQLSNAEIRTLDKAIENGDQQTYLRLMEKAVKDAERIHSGLPAPTIVNIDNDVKGVHNQNQGDVQQHDKTTGVGGAIIAGKEDINLAQANLQHKADVAAADGAAIIEDAKTSHQAKVEEQGNAEELAKKYETTASKVNKFNKGQHLK